MHSQKEMKRLSAADFAYEQLKERIIEMDLSPSSQIQEERLSQELSISRTPLRQALYRLELEGLMYKQPNGRMFIADITLEEAREVYRVRELLESLVAREAAENITTKALFQLEDIIALMKRAAKTSRNDEVVKYGADFHNILYDLSTNKTAKRFLSQLHNQIERYRRVGGYKNPDYTADIPFREHDHILQLLKQQNADAVEEAMRSHIKRSLVTIEETINIYLDSKAKTTP